MKIRTQLVAAFLLLAIVPLMSSVLYSYFSSKRAVERAVEAEAGQLTEEMDQRMNVIKAKLERGFERLRDLPFGALLNQGEGQPRSGVFMRQLMAEISEVAPYLESLTFVPEPPDAPPAAADAEPTPVAPVPPLTARPPGTAAQVGDAPRPPRDPEIPSLRIDMSRLMEEYRESRGRDEGGATGEVEVSEAEVAAAIGRDTAEIMTLGIQQAMEALRRDLDPQAQEGEAEGTRLEFEERAEQLGRNVELLQERLARTERHRAILAVRAEEHRQRQLERSRAERLLRQDLGVEIRDQGALVGKVHADLVGTDVLLRRVLESTPRGHGEIPFAFDGEGHLYPVDEADRPLLESLGLEPRDPPSRARSGDDEWMIVWTHDPDTDLIFGVAHPIGDSLAEIRDTMARNLAFGLGLVFLALLGILPLSKRITHGLEVVTEGAAKIARGDLSTRVPVESENEIGQLAATFNSMAEDLRKHQDRLLEEEGKRKEQELEKRFLEVEFQRKSRELEDAREFQLSLLPKSVPEHPAFEVAVDMQTATEVGGDYYDFHLAEDGTLTLAIGDATGHGARAGTMVTVVKSLFSSLAPELALPDFLRQASATIRRMDLGRMAMTLSVARLDDEGLVLSAAGMPPALLHRSATGEVEELTLAGMPLGGLESDYEELRVRLRAGDTLLFLSDGLPELPNAEGEPLGYPEVKKIFAAASGQAPAAVIDAMTDAAARRTGGQPPSDDMTFVVVRKR